MTNFSNALETKLLNATLNNSGYTSAETVYAALCDSVGADGDSVSELATSGAYGRKAVPFTVPSGGSANNSGAVTWEEATATWGTVSHVGLYSSILGGDLLYWAALTTERYVDNGDTFQIPDGNLTVTLD